MLRCQQIDCDQQSKLKTAVKLLLKATRMFALFSSLYCSLLELTRVRTKSYNSIVIWPCQASSTAKGFHPLQSSHAITA
tara:strand:- start:349 stop:585 length:237 start_codon:yes stop_codon:yes gene_type:complete